MHHFLKRAVTGILLSVFIASPVLAIGQSAVITLVFPPGARATGLGEAFTGLADDANATFFNPAGLGQAPLANAWKSFVLQNTPKITAIASKRKKDFSLKEKIWVGTVSGLLQYDGNAWVSYDKYLIGQDDSPLRIVKKYLSVDDEEILDKAVSRLKETNGIDGKRIKALTSYLRAEAGDSLLRTKKSSIERLVAAVLDLPKADRTAPKIYGIIAGKVDSLKVSKMSDDVADLLKIDDVSFEDMVDLKIPFTIAVSDTVTALCVDSLERLWVGTTHGMWRYDGAVWSVITVGDGLPSNSITAFAVGPDGNLAVGTDKGPALLAEGKCSGLAADSAPPSRITSIAFGKPGTMYFGTSRGVLVKKDSLWSVLDSTAGLLSDAVNALMFDSQNRLWIGGNNGVTVYGETAWKRYKFPGSTVQAIAEYGPGNVWIGTDKGVINYKQGKLAIDKSGKQHEMAPEWKAVHSKNGLKGDDVRGLAIHGKDVWAATDVAVNEYAYAEKQVLTFWEPLLPAFNLPELWHVYFAVVWPTEEWGTIGVTVNYINFGTNEWTNEQGAVIGRARSWEGVFGLSYGLSLMQDFSLGLNLKYAHSALAPGFNGGGDEGTGRTFAVDASLLKRNFLAKNLDLGFTMQNMGPNIFYISQQEQDPIPFTLKLGTAYHAIKTPIHNLTLLLDLNREVVKNYLDKKPDPFWKALYTDLIHDTTSLQDTTHSRFFNEMEEVNLNAGIEYWYANFLALRVGHLFDYIGKRFELTLGMGLKYGNINVDWSFIHSPEGFMKGIVREGANGSRNGQYRLSMIFKM